MEPFTQAAELVAKSQNELSIYHLFMQAGIFVKIIMGLLVSLSVVTWAVLFAKHSGFRDLKRKAGKFEEAFWSNRGLEELYKNATPEDADHPMAKLYIVGLREWESAQEDNAESKTTLQVGVIDRVRQLMSVRMNRELDRLEKMLPFLATVGSTAPFVGLLGTVWGIMNSFQSIGATKNTSLAVVAPGIAEALLATALGLFAAIPAVVAYNKLSTELGRYAARLETFVTEFVTILDRQNQENIAKTKRETKKRRVSDYDENIDSTFETDEKGLEEEAKESEKTSFSIGRKL